MQYIQECPEPALPIPLTNGQLVLYTKSLRDVLRVCNTDKAALRTWAEQLNK